MPNKPTIKDEWVVAAARLFERWHKQPGVQEKIRKELEEKVENPRMKIDKSRVSKWLNTARKEGLLSVTVSIDLTKATETACDAADDLLEGTTSDTEKRSKDLQDRLTQFGVQRVVVTPTREGDWECRLNAFAEDIAQDLKTQLSLCSCVGVAWGETVGRCVRAVIRLELSPKQKKSTALKTFVPLCGEGPEFNQYSATNSAADLHYYFNGKRSDRPLSLTGVPAFLPFNQSPEKRQKFRQQVASVVPGLAKVLAGDGEQPGFAERCELFLTSAGLAEQPVLKYFIHHLSEPQASAFEKMICGDCFGALIERQDLDGSDQELISDLQTMWTGVNLNNLSRGWNEPKLALVAIGENKSEITHALIARKNWVKLLYCDVSLGKGLRKRLDS